MKNFLITGKPGSGKTTLILEVIKKLNTEVYGFYTKEIRDGGVRIGFELRALMGAATCFAPIKGAATSFDERKGILAHRDIKSELRVGKYGVSLKDLEEIGVKGINDGIKNQGLIVIDEIGKMELFSDKFKSVVFIALDSDSKVLATIIDKPHPIADKIKARKDVKILRIEDITSESLYKLLTQ